MHTQTQASPMRAAIDIGSNTIHLVVARCSPKNLEIVDDQVDLTRIGESVTATGQISPEKTQQAIATLQHYKELAAQHGSQDIFVVATEAIRQASNSSQFISEVKEHTGLTVQLISGTAEAALTFYGATYGPGLPPQIGVMDLGGGSMELVMAKNSHISWRTSVPIGSGWLHDRYLHGDPPSHEEVSVAEEFLRTYFRRMQIKRFPSTLIVTGGSANSLLFLAQRAFQLDPQNPVLTYEDLLRCEGLLSALPAEDIARLYAQPLARARILPAGALIIRHMLKRLRLKAIRVSPHGIREGVLLAYTRYGDRWLDIVSRADQQATTAQSASPDEETFVQSGRRMLNERMEKFLEWPAEVLKHEDIEAVHKMRVASRRLRATLDAYQVCCEPVAFNNVYKKVKKAADTLGIARDTDVMIAHLQETRQHMPEEEQVGVQWLVGRLKEFRQSKQTDLERYLRTLDGEKLRRQAKNCIPEGEV